MKPIIPSPLAGRTVFLLGGAVEDEEFTADPGYDSAIDEQNLRIEEAVASIVRAVLARGARLGLVDDSVFTPLALQICNEYWEPAPAEGTPAHSEDDLAPILIFGQIPALPDEAASWYQQGVNAGMVQYVSPYQQFSQPAALAICVGGVSNLDNIVGSFLKRNLPVFTLPSTGGAARQIAHERNVVDVETKLLAEIARRRGSGSDVSEAPERGVTVEEERMPEFVYSAYPLLISIILDGQLALAS